METSAINVEVLFPLPANGARLVVEKRDGKRGRHGSSVDLERRKTLSMIRNAMMGAALVAMTPSVVRAERPKVSPVSSGSEVLTENQLKMLIDRYPDRPIQASVLFESRANIAPIFSESRAATDPLMLTGIFGKPAGRGPFPGAVLLHGCGGINSGEPRAEYWQNQLHEWGYATLAVDSFGPRGLKRCSIPKEGVNFPFTIPFRAHDAYGSKSFLGTLPSVNEMATAAIGWSHGGWSVIEALNKGLATSSLSGKHGKFGAGVAFYPVCERRLEPYAPLLILVGEPDGWGSLNYSQLCTSNMPSTPADPPVILQTYPDTYHAFDWPGIDKVVGNGKMRMRYDKKVADDATARVKAFLTRYVAP